MKPPVLFTQRFPKYIEYIIRQGRNIVLVRAIISDFLPPSHRFYQNLGKLLTEILEGGVHPDDVRVRQLGQRPLLHEDLVVHVLMTPLQAGHLRLLDHLQGERLSRAFVLGLQMKKKTNENGKVFSFPLWILSKKRKRIIVSRQFLVLIRHSKE